MNRYAKEAYWEYTESEVVYMRVHSSIHVGIQ